MDLQGRNINILKDIGISFDWRVNKDYKKLEYRDLTGPEKLLVMQSINFQSLLPNFKKTKEMEKLWASFMESIGDLKLEFTTNDGITQLTNKINSWFDKFVCLYQAKDVTSYMHALPYLPVYELNPCISRPPILEPKNKFFLFLKSYKCGNCEGLGHTIKTCSANCMKCQTAVCCAHPIKVDGRWTQVYIVNFFLFTLTLRARLPS